MPPKTETTTPAATGKPAIKKDTEPKRAITQVNKSRALLAFKIGVFRASFVLLLSCGMLYLGVTKHGRDCEVMDDEIFKFLKYAGIAGIFLFGFGLAKSLLIFFLRKAWFSCCKSEYNNINTDAKLQMTKRSAIMSWFDVFSMLPVAGWLSWGSVRVYDVYWMTPKFLNSEDCNGKEKLCQYCYQLILTVVQGIVGAGWAMFLITGVMTIVTIYYLPNDALTFKKSLSSNMKA